MAMSQPPPSAEPTCEDLPGVSSVAAPIDVPKGDIPASVAGKLLNSSKTTIAPVDSAAVPTDRRSSSRTPVSGVERRNSVVDRRAGIDRRTVDIGGPTGLERRRGPGRRRTDDRRSAEEGEMTDEQFEFVLAIDTYKRLNNRPFPSWTEVLEVIKQLGYRKVTASQLNLPGLNKNGTGQDDE
jgi:hypothetical protein